MKKLFILLSLLSFLSCNEEPTEPEQTQMTKTEFREYLQGEWELNVEQSEITIDESVWPCIDFSFDFIDYCGLDIDRDYDIIEVNILTLHYGQNTRWNYELTTTDENVFIATATRNENTDIEDTHYYERK